MSLKPQNDRPEPPRPPLKPIEWQRASGLTPYPEAVAVMEACAQAIREGDAPERVWLVEHPALYTAGTSADEGDLLDGARFEVFESGRGGQHTYHGPGQRVAYVMMDLKHRGSDVRRFVRDLEELMIQTLATFGVEAGRREGRIGIWVARADGSGFDDKIGAIGVRVRKWVTFHGLSLNVNPDLEHYSGIVPCGIAEHGVTSLAALGVNTTMSDVDARLRETFEAVFGRKTTDGA